MKNEPPADFRRCDTPQIFAELFEDQAPKVLLRFFLSYVVVLSALISGAFNPR